MKMNTSLTGWRRVLREAGPWAMTLVPVGMFVAAFVLIVTFEVDSSVTHLLLAIWSLTGVIITIYLFTRICHIHQLIRWPGMIPFGIAAVFFIFGVWQAVAAGIASLWAVGFVLFLVLMKYFIESPKKHRVQQDELRNQRAIEQV